MPFQKNLKLGAVMGVSSEKLNNLFQQRVSFDRKASLVYCGKNNDCKILIFQPGKLLPSAHAVEREFTVMKAMSQNGVPIPKMYGLCEDSK